MSQTVRDRHDCAESHPNAASSFQLSGQMMSGTAASRQSEEARRE